MSKPKCNDPFHSSLSMRAGHHCFINTKRMRFDSLRRRNLALRHVHDHAREQIQARLDGVEQHVFRVGGVGAVTLQAETLDTGALVLSAAKAASVPPPSRRSSTTSFLPSSA